MTEEQTRFESQVNSDANPYSDVGFEKVEQIKEPSDKVERPSWLESHAANLRQHGPFNSVSQNVVNQFVTLNELDEDPNQVFNPLDKKYLSQVDPQYWPLVVTSRTEGEFYRRKDKLDQEYADRDIIDRTSFPRNLLMGAHAGLPVALLGVSGNPELALPAVGEAFIAGAVRALPGLAIANAAEEANLYLNQELRTKEESIFNAGIQTLFGGLVAGTGNAIRALKPNIYKKLIEETVNGKDVKFGLNEKGEVTHFNIYDDSAGSMSVTKLDLEGDRLLGYTQDGKFSVAQPFFWMAGKLLRNPVVLGLSSKSAHVARFTNDLYEHSMDVVKSSVHGAVKNQSIQTKLDKYNIINETAARNIYDSYSEYLGLDKKNPKLNTVKSIKDFEGKMNFQDYANEYAIALTNGGKSDIPSIARSSKEVYKMAFDPIQKELEDLNILAPNVTPFGASQYLTRIPDRQYMLANKPTVLAFFKDKFADTNAKLFDIEQTRLSLADNEKALNKYNRKINRQILKGEIPPDMLVGEKGMTYPDIQELKAIRKPLKIMKQNIKQLEEELRVVTREANPNRKPGKKNAPLNERQTDITSKIEAEKERLKAAREQIHLDVETGKVKKHFAFKKGEMNFLRKPDRGTLKLRAVLDDEQLTTSALNAFENMTGLSDHQLVANMMDSMKSGSNGNNPFMPRTLMIDDESLYRNKILVGNPVLNIRAYTKRMGSIIEMQKYLKQQGWDGTGKQLDYMVNGIKNDYVPLERALEEKYTKLSEGKSGKKLADINKKAQKERLKLAKSLEQDVALVQDGYRRVTGGYEMPQSQKEWIRLSRFMNSWGHATQMGAALLVCLGDSVSPIMRAGPKSWVMHGALPLLRNFMAGDFKANALMRESAADMNIGFEVLSSMQSMRFNIGQDIELPSNFIERLGQNSAKTMGLANGVQIWSDYTKTAAVGMAQSHIIRDLTKYMSGKLSANAEKQLAVLSLNDKYLGQVILDMFKEHGNVIRGGYLPNFNDWGKGVTDLKRAADIERAKDLFRGAVKHEVNSVIFSGPNIASYPSQLNAGGQWSMFLTYMGFMFNATSNYLLPLLQRFDPNKVIGAAAMVSVSMLTDPLRLISQGKDPNLDPEHLLWQGFLNSGVGGLPVDFFNRANAAFNIFPDLVSNRFQGKGFELAAGMVGSTFDLGINIGNMAINGPNKAGLKKLKRATPLLELFYLRSSINDFIEGLDIPDTLSDSRKYND